MKNNLVIKVKRELKKKIIKKIVCHQSKGYNSLEMEKMFSTSRCTYTIMSQP